MSYKILDLRSGEYLTHLYFKENVPCDIIYETKEFAESELNRHIVNHKMFRLYGVKEDSSLLREFFEIIESNEPSNIVDLYNISKL